MDNTLLPVERFIDTLSVVGREAEHLTYSWHRIYDQPISPEWVERLADDPQMAERLDAFVSRYGRMQDTMAEKLLPCWLAALAEGGGTQIEVLNRAERLGILESVEHWLEARKLRNRLVHEYMDDAARFAEDLMLAREYAEMLLDSYNRMIDFASSRMDIPPDALPAKRQLHP